VLFGIHFVKADNLERTNFELVSFNVAETIVSGDVKTSPNTLPKIEGGILRSTNTIYFQFFIKNI